MIVFLSLLQIFIPFQTIQKYELPELNKYEFNKLVATNTTIIAFAVEKRYKEMDPVISSMNEVASLFADTKLGGASNEMSAMNSVHFVFMERNLATEAAYHSNLALPSFFIFKNGSLASAYPYPRNDVTFVKQIQALLNATEISTKNELLWYLGDCYYTILALPELYEEAVNVLHKFSNEMDIVIVNKELLNDLDLDDDRLALYRREDDMIVSFSNFSIASVPYYSVLNYYTLYQEVRPVFGIIGPTFNNNMKDLLYELSEKHPDFLFGYINNDYYAFFNTTIKVVLNGDFMNVLLFNTYKRFHYDVSDIFTNEFYGKEFEMKEWLKRSNDVINSIKQNNRKKIYISESPPPKEENDKSPIQKVVGLTYNEFVNQKDKDVLILFNGHQFVEQNMAYNRTFNDLYKITTNHSMTNLSFGQIDITSNSGDFPYLPEIPQIFLYPAKNKSNPVPLRGNPSIDNLFWFIKRYGTFEVPFEVEPMSHKQFEMDFYRLMRNVMRMPEDEKEKFFDWAYEMANLTNTDIAHLPGVPKREHDHHHHHHGETDYDEL